MTACRGATVEPSPIETKRWFFIDRTERTKPLTATLPTGASGAHSRSPEIDVGALLEKERRNDRKCEAEAPARLAAPKSLAGCIFGQNTVVGAQEGHVIHR